MRLNDYTDHQYTGGKTMSEFEDKLHSIPGLSQFIDNGFIRIGEEFTSDTLPDTLTMDDLEFLPDIDTLDEEGLEAILERLEDLLDDLESEEPDEEDEAHNEWEDSIDEVTDFIDEVQSRIEEMEDE